MHPYLEAVSTKGKGKRRILHRESWNRRRRAFEGHSDPASQRTMTTTGSAAQEHDNADEQPPSEHPSMPELLDDIPEEGDDDEGEEEEEEIDDDADADPPPHRERSFIY